MQMYPRIIAESSCLPPERPRVVARCGNGSRFRISQIHMGSQREVKAVTKIWLKFTSASICMSVLICRQIFFRRKQSMAGLVEEVHGAICCPSFEGGRERTTEKRRCVGRNKSGGKSVAANCLVVKWHCVSSIRRRRDCRETRKSEGNLSPPST